MTWSLTASGNADDPEQQKTLAASLGQVLANAGAVVTGASFSGTGYNGDPRDLAAAPPTA